MTPYRDLQASSCAADVDTLRSCRTRSAQAILSCRPACTAAYRPVMPPALRHTVIRSCHSLIMAGRWSLDDGSTEGVVVVRERVRRLRSALLESRLAPEVCRAIPEVVRE